MPTNLYKQLMPIAVAASIMSPLGFSANTATYGTSTRAESLQAFVALADDPSAVFYNPAGLTQLKGTQLDAGTAIVLPRAKYRQNGAISYSTRGTFAPNVFISSDHYQKFMLGLGLYAPFAREASYDNNIMTNPHVARLVRLDLTPTIAFHLTPALSLGLSAVASRIEAKTDILGIAADANGYGFTGQVGLLYQTKKHFSIGLDYRGPMKAHVNGHASWAGNTGGYHSSLRFPGVATVGFAWQFMSKWIASFAYEYEMWRTIKNIPRVYDNPTMAANLPNSTAVNGKNVGSIRTGLLYRPEAHNEYRVGYSYFPRAIPGTFITPATPDFDANAVSVGYSYKAHPWRFDLGYEYVFTTKATHVNNPNFPGEYSLKANILLASVSYQFD